VATGTEHVLHLFSMDVKDSVKFTVSSDFDIISKPGHTFCARVPFTSDMLKCTKGAVLFCNMTNAFLIIDVVVCESRSEQWPSQTYLRIPGWPSGWNSCKDHGWQCRSKRHRVRQQAKVYNKPRFTKWRGTTLPQRSGYSHPRRANCAPTDTWNTTVHCSLELYRIW